MYQSSSELVRIHSRHGPADIRINCAGTGEPVLLIAGLGGRATFWNAQVAALATQYRVITHDHRGVGGSTESRIILTPENMADDVIALMDALDIERAMIIGHSTGGSISQFLALRHRDRVVRLVMSACWAGPTALFVETFRLRRRVLLSQGPQAYYFLSALLGAPASWLAPGFDSLAAHVAERMAEFPGLEIELGRLAAVISHDLRNELGKIEVPTLVIGTSDDQLTSCDMQEEVAQRIPGARLSLLPYGGHLFPVTQPEAYNQLLLEFLAAGRQQSFGAMS